MSGLSPTQAVGFLNSLYSATEAISATNQTSEEPGNAPQASSGFLSNLHGQAAQAATQKELQTKQEDEKVQQLIKDYLSIVRETIQNHAAAMIEESGQFNLIIWKDREESVIRGTAPNARQIEPPKNHSWVTSDGYNRVLDAIKNEILPFKIVVETYKQGGTGHTLYYIVDATSKISLFKDGTATSVVNNNQIHEALETPSGKVLWEAEKKYMTADRTQQLFDQFKSHWDAVMQKNVVLALSTRSVVLHFKFNAPQIEKNIKSSFSIHSFNFNNVSMIQITQLISRLKVFTETQNASCYHPHRSHPWKGDPINTFTDSITEESIGHPHIILDILLPKKGEMEVDFYQPEQQDGLDGFKVK